MAKKGIADKRPIMNSFMPRNSTRPVRNSPPVSVANILAKTPSMMEFLKSADNLGGMDTILQKELALYGNNEKSSVFYFFLILCIWMPFSISIKINAAVPDTAHKSSSLPVSGWASKNRFMYGAYTATI